MRHSLRILSTVLVVVVTAWAAALPSLVPAAAATQPLVSLQDFENLMDEVLAHRQRIQRYQPLDEYCIEPEFHTKNDDREFLNKLEAINGQLKKKFQFLMAQALVSFGKSGGWRLAAAYPKVNGMGPLDSGWGNPNDYWNGTTWAQRIQNLTTLLKAKRAEMESKDEVTCRKAPPQKPQPVDWMRGLTRPAPEQITFAKLPPHFCSANEKDAWIAANINDEVQQAADNARDAADYVVEVGKVRLQLQGMEIAGTIDEDGKKGLKDILAEYKWAQDNRAKHDAEAAAIKAHAAKASAIPIIDCSPPQQPQTDDATPIGQPDYEMFVYPEVPDRFCREDEKQAVLSQLDIAKKTARSNYEKAKAHAAELQKRLDAGDKTPGLPTAKHDADQAATTYYNLWIALDDAYSKALAMPVEKCGGVITGAGAGAEAGAPTGAIPGAEAGAQMGTRAATVKEIGFNFNGGFKQTDTPQTWIGRIVVAGEDTALARTPDTLEGYFAGAYIEVMKSSGEPLFGDSASLGILMHFSSVEGDQTAVIDTPAGGATGYVFIDPTDPTRPVGGTGIATGFGSWETRTSADQRTFDVAAMYREFLGRDVSLGAGVFVRAQDTELSGWQSHLGVPGLTANERYDISTVDVGAIFEALLRREISGGVFVEASAFVAPTIASRDYEAVQRTTAPAPFSFDYTQRRDFDDDGFNLLYGVNASIGIEVADGYRLSLIAGWQGETDAPTIRPADGSAPGAPIGPDTESASEWHVGLKLGGPLN